MALTKIPSSLLDTSGGFDLQGNITLGDNERIQFGDGTDLQIYHSGANSFITDTGTGNLNIKTNDGTGIYMLDATGNMADFTSGGAVTLRYNNDAKIATSSTGATVTGTLTVTGDLDITGDINSYNVTDLDVTDQTITLGAGQTEANSGGSGIIIDGSSASILWNETNDEWDFNKAVNINGGVEAYNFAANNSITIDNSSGYAAVEMGGSSGAYIDLKNPSSDDYDLRIITFGTGGQILSATGSPLLLASSGNSNQLYLASSGNVGIGTDSPDGNLEVRTNQSMTFGSDTVDSITIGTSGTNKPCIKFDTADTTHTNRVWAIENGAGGRLNFFRNGLDVLKLNQDGSIEIPGNDVLIGSSTNLNVLSGTPKIQVGDGSGHASIQWYSGTGSVAGLYFGDASSGSARYEGYIEYRHNTNSMAFRTGGGERVIIDSTGNVDVNTGRIKVVNTGTDAYFFEGVRSGGNTTLRMYDNNNNLYIDSYTNMTFRANQTGGGSGGNFFFGGGNVGIGLPSGSPDAKLTVSGSANSEQVIITGNGNQSRGLSILTAATGGQQDAKVIFNAQDTENVAYPAMQFETGGTEKIRMHHMSTIFSNRVGLNYPSELMFNGEYTAGQADVAVEAGHAARIEFLKDDFFRIQGSASVSAGAGVSYADKLKINIDAGGILFGSDTAAANTLNDYEEGTWTPTITFGGGSTGQTYIRRQGKYIKIGSLVYIQGHLYFSNKGSSTGQAGLAGLPFPPSSNSSGTFSPIGDRGNLNTGGRGVNCYLHASSTTFPLYDGGFDGSANSDTNHGDFNNSTEIDVNFCYYTDA